MGEITVHMVVKNEDQWIWFAIMSVIEYVERILIFDTGSVDNTVEVIRTIMDKPQYKNKIYFEEIGKVSVQDFYKVRQRQIDMTDTDYMMVVDGDEIWWKEGMEELQEIIDKHSPMCIATKFFMPAGDLYHYRDFNRELYSVAGVNGSISTRVISMNIPGLVCGGDYGVEGYHGRNGSIADYKNYEYKVMEHFYFHCSKLRRSSAIWGDESIKYRRKKITDEWDYEFPKDYHYPEVFYLPRPPIVPNPFDSKDNLTKRIAKKVAKVYRHYLKGLLGG